jgi:hypothetical protein
MQVRHGSGTVLTPEQPIPVTISNVWKTHPRDEAMPVTKFGIHRLHVSATGSARFFHGRAPRVSGRAAGGGLEMLCAGTVQ